MDLVLLAKAIALGIVEGLTEFLPISSTGHLILAGTLLDFNYARAKAFEVVIQTGAMLAVVWEYRERFGRLARVFTGDAAAWAFARNLAIAFLPAALLGLVFSKAIKAHLFHPVPVAIAFIFGALVILWVERAPRVTRVQSVDEMSALDALKLGLAQAVALIPGTSRSGATIIGGLLFGLSRRAATEFSFFLAVPTLLAAGLYDLYKERDHLGVQDVPIFLAGSIAALISAFLCVRWLIRFVSGHDFRAFAWYRIAFGIVVLVTHGLGWVDWSSG